MREEGTLLASVRNDLLVIQAHVATQSVNVSVGRSFVEALRRGCDELAGLPGTLTRSRPELRPELRSVAYGAYVIFFRYVGERFEVVAIQHGSRDLDALFDAGSGL